VTGEPAVPVLVGWDQAPFSYGGTTREVFRRGDGPAVIVIAEVPGITPAVIGFADRVVGVGCTAVLPRLFGRPGVPPSPGAVARTLPPLCVSRQFRAWATDRTSPVIGWLRALARREHQRSGGPGVGVVGMCFTGGFALAMMVDPSVTAPVLSQPSLPLPVGKARRRDLHIEPDDLAEVKRRVAADPDLCVLGLRFTGDIACPGERFDRLREELGDAFVAVEIDSSPGNPHDIRRRAHSVLTEDLVDEPGHPTLDALDRVLELLRRRLLGGDPPT
jgi:dienelactone hydrolase